jgi:hypothetical protein
MMAMRTHNQWQLRLSTLMRVSMLHAMTRTHVTVVHLLISVLACHIGMRTVTRTTTMFARQIRAMRARATVDAMLTTTTTLTTNETQARVIVDIKLTTMTMLMTRLPCATTSVTTA